MINVNSVVLVGRLTKDVEMRKTESNHSVCSFTVAINRWDKNADFINCVAWTNSAEFLHTYAMKGDIVSVEGRIQTRNYDGKDGKVYVTEVIADNVQLISENREKPQHQPKTEIKWDLRREDIPTEIYSDEDLPF